MSKIAFLVGHPEIKHGHASCKNLMDKLSKQGEKHVSGVYCGDLQMAHKSWKVLV